jgi:hypothetical protein
MVLEKFSPYDVGEISGPNPGGLQVTGKERS